MCVRVCVVADIVVVASFFGSYEARFFGTISDGGGREGMLDSCACTSTLLQVAVATCPSYVTSCKLSIYCVYLPPFLISCQFLFLTGERTADSIQIRVSFGSISVQELLFCCL